MSNKLIETMIVGFNAIIAHIGENYDLAENKIKALNRIREDIKTLITDEPPVVNVRYYICRINDDCIDGWYYNNEWIDKFNLVAWYSTYSAAFLIMKKLSPQTKILEISGDFIPLDNTCVVYSPSSNLFLTLDKTWKSDLGRALIFYTKEVANISIQSQNVDCKILYLTPQKKKYCIYNNSNVSYLMKDEETGSIWTVNKEKATVYGKKEEADRICGMFKELFTFDYKVVEV